MASIISCNRIRGSVSANTDELGMGVYKVRYLVQTDGVMGPKSLLQAAWAASPDAVPQYWTSYSYLTDVDYYSFVRDYEIESDEHTTTKYYITVTYRPLDKGEGSQDVGGDPINKPANPVNREAVMWWDREVYTSIALRDKDGKAIVNKCQDYYPEDIELEQTRGVLVIEKNYATLGEVIDLSTAYDGTVNSTAWTVAGRTAAARTALCREVSSGAAETEQGYVFFHVVFRFAFRATTWDEPKVECGQFHWTKTGGEYDMSNGHRRITDAQKIVPLNTDGTRLADGEDFITTNWRVRREANFNALGFV